MVKPTMAVWSDFGGVLTAPVTVTITAFCERIGVAPPTFGVAIREVAALFGTSDVMEPLDTPLVDAPGYAALLGRVLAENHGVTVDLTDFVEKWFTDRTANTALVEHLSRLRAGGHFVGLLSNMPPAFDGQWQRVVAADLFDDLVLSSREGCRKPQRRIYDISALRCGRPAQDCVLIDDIAENCAAAREAGWQAIEFTSTEEVVARLDDLLVGQRLRT
jgi:putative hydrolase of the HAD superfamily